MMFELKKLGIAVAFAALTSFAASGVSASPLFPNGATNPDDRGLSNLFETIFLNNGSANVLAGGTLAQGTDPNAPDLNVGDDIPATFTDVFSFDIDGPGVVPESRPVFYSFSVTNDGAQNGIGIADLTFTVYRDEGGAANPTADPLNTITALASFQITDGSGDRVDGINGTQFTGPWNVGDRIIWEVTGGVFAQGGSYEFSVTAVPLPASVLMLVGALAGLGFVGRMKKSRFASA